MAAKRNIDILFFEELLEELSFTKGVDTYIRIHQLLENWQPTDDAEEDIKKLRVKLGSLLANSPEEQRAFYQRFDGYASRYAYAQAQEVPSPLPPPSLMWRWLFSLVVMSLILAGIWLLITDPKDTFVERGLAFDSAELSKTVWFQNLAVPFSKEPFLSNRMIKYTWDFGDGSPKVETTEAIISHTYEKRDGYFVTVIAESAYGKDTTTRRVRAGLGGILLSSLQDQENPLDWQMELSKERFREINFGGEEVSAQKIIEEIAAEEQELSNHSRYLVDGLILFGDGALERFFLEDTAERVLFSHNYEFPGRYEVNVYYSYYKIDKTTGAREEVLKDTTLTGLLIEGEYSYDPVDIPEISFEEINIDDLLKQQQTDWRPELLFAIAFLLYACYEWWKWKRRKPVLDISNDLHDPDWQPLQLDRPQVNLFRSEPFEKWALSLRRQKHTEREELDLNATLKDTLEKGGFPSLLFKPGQQTSQYLFLIECYGIHDQQAAYYKELVVELEQRDISTEVWFYHPARKKLVFFRDPQKPGENTSADGLSRLYGNYRLVIIGDGKGWDRNEARLESVKDWLEKTWISTRPPAHWDRREVELARHFLLLPAQEEAFLSMVEVWSDVQEGKDLNIWREKDRTYDLPDLEDVESLPLLKRYLGKNAFHCLCATAIYPEMYWELCLAYANMCGLVEGGRVKQDFLKLLNLLWYREGRIPEEWKALLMEEIPAPLKEGVYSHLISVLEQPQNMAANHPGTQKQNQALLAVYKYHVEKDKDKAARELGETIRGEVSPEYLRDIVSVRTVSKVGRKDQLIPLPGSFYHYGIPLYGEKDWIRLVKVLMVLLLLLAGRFGFRILNPLQVEYAEPYQEEYLQLTSAQDSAKWMMYQGNQKWQKMIDEDPYDGTYQSSSDYEAIVPYYKKAVELDPGLGSAMRNFALVRYHQARLAYLDQDLQAALSAFGTDADSIEISIPESLLDEIRFLMGLIWLENPDPEVMGFEIPEVETGSGYLSWRLIYTRGYYFRISDSLPFPTVIRPSSTVRREPSYSINQAFLSTLSLYSLGADFYQMDSSLFGRLALEDKILFNNKREANLRGQLGENEFLLDSLDNWIFGLDNRAATLLTEAERLRAEGKCEEAIDLYQQVLILDPDNEDAKSGIQFCSTNDQNTGNSPDSLNLLLFQADSLLKKQACEAARDLYNQVLEQDPKNSLARRGLKAVVPCLQNQGSELDTTLESRTLYIKGQVGWEIEPRIPAMNASLEAQLEPDTYNYETVDGKAATTLTQRIRTNTTGGFLTSFETVYEDGKVLSLSDLIDKLTISISGDYLQSTSLEIASSEIGASLGIRQVLDTLILDTLTVRIQADVGEFVEVEGGTFMMGSEDGNEDEKPVHEVTLSSFNIQKYEVTVAQYMYYVQEGEGALPDWLVKGHVYYLFNLSKEHYSQLGKSLFSLNHPIVGVSWEDASAYANWWSSRGKYTYSLPTEAQWEFAARGGNKSKGYYYAGGDVRDLVGWFNENSGGTTHPVGTKSPNELGLYDMSGNVWEWCLDWYGTYPISSQIDPEGPLNGDSRVIRGISWNDNISWGLVGRYSFPPVNRQNTQGFRLSHD